MKLAETDTKPAWCPGCGNYSLLKTFDEALEEAGVDRHKLVLVSGIGQAAKLPHYTRGNVFNGLHGRALPAATGIKLSNHKLEVTITSGDGDMYGEGGNHFLHAIRRNIGVKVFVHDNQVYGLTKGQASPTSDLGMVTKIQKHGVMSLPFNPLAIAILEECSLVARSFVGERDHLRATMVAALKHTGGFALVDILQPCPSFNKQNTFKWYKQRVKPVGDDHDPRDKEVALRLALRWGDEIPIGVLYRSERVSFENQQTVLAEKSLVEQYAAAEGGIS
ncbi:MAG: 2-oxoacid:ferredoxin oxidoreductase subunit beta [Sedimentisphaerales bacterium]|nr:2-oxoacid:ferredoxin oxidoreductase subunit beta [Sedimentisphaerales bacterium]